MRYLLAVEWLHDHQAKVFLAAAGLLAVLTGWGL